MQRIYEKIVIRSLVSFTAKEEPSTHFVKRRQKGDIYVKFSGAEPARQRMKGAFLSIEWPLSSRLPSILRRFADDAPVALVWQATTGRTAWRQRRVAPATGRGGARRTMNGRGRDDAQQLC
jgi:hypothetical protein